MIDPSLKEANILIVDDQEANIDVLDGFLEMQGYVNIKTVTDPREVVPLLGSFQPDLILLDLTMPYMSGFEVMEKLNKLIPTDTFLPILVLTADITTEAKIRALSGGASDFLTKPFDLIEVGLRIKNLLYTSYLQQQLQNQNKILDEKVKKRTSELEQKNIELNSAKEKAEASDKLKTSFINNISHEIRTPLNGILGFGQILTDPDLRAEEKNEYLAILNESSYRLINTVSNFMDISMISSGNQEVNKKDFNPEYVITAIAEQFSTLCDEKKLKLLLDVPSAEKEARIFSDKELLLKILRHLMDNAVKFTSHGSITLGYKINDKDFTFFVKDTGKGISEEGKQTIFSNFMQEDNSYTRGYEGCGLGLSIATGIIELLGGTIWLDSEKEKGSTFYFKLPIQQITYNTEIIQRKDKTEGVKTILVAEDDEINFIYINILLKSNQTKVIRAIDGQEAISICKTHPEICAVLIDLRMPVIDGFEAARQIKAIRSDLPIFAVTAYSGGEEKLHAKESGCDEFITKPIEKELLIEKLARYGIVVGSKIKS
jgi:signal transduction histidine kinase